jgi:hypothetical protein
MAPRSATWGAIAAVVAMLLVGGCSASPSGQATPRPSIAPNSEAPAGGGGASEAPSTAPTFPPTSQPSPTSAATPTVPPTPQPTPSGLGPGPYSVNLTHPEGGLVMDTPPGGVCVNHPFQIPASNPSVSFTLMFDPTNGNAFSYSYTVPDAGETDDATGTYVLTPHGDGSLTVSVTAQDHMVAQRLDVMVPVNYSFDLVPLGSGSCP